MTMFSTFQGSFRKQDVTLFTDCVGDVAPFGISLLNTSTLSTTTYSSKNTDSADVVNPLGTVSIQTPDVAITAGTYAAIGIYPAAPVTGSVNRDFRVGRGEVEIEARVKSGATQASIAQTVGIGLCHNDGTAGFAREFVGFCLVGTDSDWKAIVVSNYVTVRTVSATAPKGKFNVLRVVLSDDATRAKCYANGKLVASFVTPMDKTLGLLPAVETRDRTSGGTAIAAQSMEVDYVLARFEANR